MRSIRIKSQEQADLIGSEFDGNIFILESVQLPQLQTIGGYLYVGADVQLPQLQTIGGDLSVGADVQLPQLQTIGGYLSVGADVQLPQLQTIGGDLYVGADVQLPQLQTIGGDLSVGADVDFKAFEVKRDILIFLTEMFQINYKNGEYFLKKYTADFIIQVIKLRHTSYKNFYQREVVRMWNVKNCIKDLLQYIEQNWYKVSELKASDIFKINDLDVRRLCFQYLPPENIMKELKAERIAVEGIEMDYFKFENKVKKPFKKHNIYEVYEVKANRLDSELSGNIHAVRCWCTSTNKEAWIWIDSKYKDDPLAAIASTFRLHENVIPHITCLKRQGDIMLVETNKEVMPEGNQRSLTKEEYFTLLQCET